MENQLSQYEKFRQEETEIEVAISNIDKQIRELQKKRHSLNTSLGDVYERRNRYWHESNGRDDKFFEQLNRKYVASGESVLHCDCP